MSKYSPLTRHLATRQKAIVPMAFQELESVLGFPLPPSARKHRAWWSNNPSNSVMTQAWLDAGYQSRDVDLVAERLVFAKLNGIEPDPLPRHPLWGVCEGMITIAPGVDLTEPALDWDDRWLDDSAALIRSGMGDAATK